MHSLGLMCVGMKNIQHTNFHSKKTSTKKVIVFYTAIDCTLQPVVADYTEV